MLVLEGLVDLHRTIQFQLLQHYWSGHRVRLLWYWMACLGNEQRSFCLFWDHTQELHLWLLLIMRATPFLLRDSAHSSSLIPVHFSSLIPKMLMFTLGIYLITSNLPWFMDLTLQVPVQYCSLQQQTLFPSPVTFTFGCCFCFGSVSSFFLELFLHWSPVAY